MDESLAQAKGVGLVEDSFTLGGCEIVLRNLTPDEYRAIQAETGELEELDYLTSFQQAHLCRAIQELNGVSLRECTFVECDEPDPKKPGQSKTVKKEKHEWLLKNVVKTWGAEATYIAFRKFNDVVMMAETHAKGNIEFRVPEETADQKYRRLCNELRELQGEVAPGLVPSILQEYGYSLYTQEADKEALNASLDQLPVPEEAPVEEEPVVVAPPSPVLREDVLRTRIPMNQVVLDAPPPTAVEAPQPVQVRSAPPQAVSSQLAAAIPMSKKAASFMALESEFDPSISTNETKYSPVVPSMEEEPPVELVRKAPPIDTKAAGQIFERPPMAGINPKFRKPG